MDGVWLNSIDSACVVVSKKVEPATEPYIYIYMSILLLPLIVLSANLHLCPLYEKEHQLQYQQQDGHTVCKSLFFF